MHTVSKTQDQTIYLLMELGVPAHRIGYKLLCLAIPLFAENDTQTLSKELYPVVAAEVGYCDWRAAEHSIRDVIVTAWNQRNPAVWAKYFPDCRRPPSNKQFIATLAQFAR